MDKTKQKKQYHADDQCHIQSELKYKTPDCLLTEGLSQVSFGKACCGNWAPYLHLPASSPCWKSVPTF